MARQRLLDLFHSRIVSACPLLSCELPSARVASAVLAAMGRLPGNRSRAEALSLGDNAVSGSRVRRRTQARPSTLRAPVLVLQLLPALLCPYIGTCSLHLATRARLQFADEAPAKPSVRAHLATLASTLLSNAVALLSNADNAA